MDDAPAVVCQHDEHDEHAERRGWDRESDERADLGIDAWPSASASALPAPGSAAAAKGAEQGSGKRTEDVQHGPGSLVEPSVNINDLAAHAVFGRDSQKPSNDHARRPRIHRRHLRSRSTTGRHLPMMPIRWPPRDGCAIMPGSTSGVLRHGLPEVVAPPWPPAAGPCPGFRAQQAPRFPPGSPCHAALGCVVDAVGRMWR